MDRHEVFLDRLNAAMPRPKAGDLRHRLGLLRNYLAGIRREVPDLQPSLAMAVCERLGGSFPTEAELIDAIGAVSAAPGPATAAGKPEETDFDAIRIRSALRWYESKLADRAWPAARRISFLKATCPAALPLACVNFPADFRDAGESFQPPPPAPDAGDDLDFPM